MQSVEELACYFVHYITQSRVGVDARIKSASTAIPSLCEKGWTLAEIKEELDRFAYTYPQVVINIYHIGEIMDKLEPPNNLLEPYTFYYHDALREMSPPPKLKKDPITGMMVRQSTPFYLEMKKRFSMQDLLNYWYEKMEISPNEHMIRQDEGKFKYILGNYTIEEILFSIDMSKILRKERQQKLLKNAFELDKYIEDGRDFMNRKINVHKMSGINREFQREHTYGSGHPYN